MSLQPENSTNSSSRSAFLDPKSPAGLSTGFKKTPAKKNSTVIIENSTLLSPDEAKVLYSVKRTIGNLRLCIPLGVASNILQIMHGKSNLGFSRRLLQDSHALLVHTGPYLAFEGIYLVLFSMPTTSDQTTSPLWVLAAYWVSACRFLHANARLRLRSSSNKTWFKCNHVGDM